MTRTIWTETRGMRIPVTVDAEDYDRLSGYSWRINRDGYAIRTSYQTVLMHRQIIGAFNEGEVIDHRNRDKLDNRKSNLRICTRAENNRNTPVRKTNALGLKGVIKLPHLQARPYRAAINANGQRHHLGYYATPEEAAHAYDTAALNLHGQYAYNGGPP